MKNTLQTLQKKRKSKKGFTLMEMLIVVAIIAILVAIAIPVFSAQLDNAKKQVDAANLRSATSMAVVDVLTQETPPTSNQTYVALDDGNKTMTVDTTGTDYYDGQSSENKTKHIQIVVTPDGDVVSAGWVNNT